MSYSNLTNFNKNFIKKFTHNSRFNIAIKILKKNFSSISINVLDYGAGGGEFLKKINKEIPGLKDISAYEPLIGRYDEVKLNISSYKNMNVYHKYDEIGKRYEVIFCMEVFEHLNKKLTIDALNNISNLLTKNGVNKVGYARKKKTQKTKESQYAENDEHPVQSRIFRNCGIILYGQVGSL